MKILHVSAHCSDLFYCAVTDADDKTIYEQQSGYVPYGTCIGGGDDLEMKIDIETGQIIGWDAEKVKRRLQEYIEQQS